MVILCILGFQDVGTELQVLLLIELDRLVAGVVWASAAAYRSAWCCDVITPTLEGFDCIGLTTSPGNLLVVGIVRVEDVLPCVG